MPTSIHLFKLRDKPTTLPFTKKKPTGVDNSQRSSFKLITLILSKEYKNLNLKNKNHLSNPYTIRVKTLTWIWFIIHFLGNANGPDYCAELCQRESQNKTSFMEWQVAFGYAEIYHLTSFDDGNQQTKTSYCFYWSRFAHTTWL